MKKLKFILICCLTSVFIFNVYTQDVLTVDGYSIGPKKFFVSVCVRNLQENALEDKVRYNANHFCNCIADEIVQKYSKSQMDYFLNQDHINDIQGDSSSLKIIFECVSKNKNTDVVEPYQIFPKNKVRDSILNELIEVCAYESFFDSIRDSRLNVLSKEYVWTNEQLNEIRNRVNFSEFKAINFSYFYSQYSTDEIKSILNYFKSLTRDELVKSKIKHDPEVIMMIKGKNDKNMDSRIRLAADQ